MTDDLFPQLKNHPFLQGMSEESIHVIADCAEHKEFADGEYLMVQNTKAEVFHLLLDGRVSLQMPVAQGAMPIETVEPPDTLGWSWLVPPYKWHYDAVADGKTSTIMVHTPCILGKVAQDKEFGCEIYERFIQVVVDRLHGTQMQMMDIYAKPESPRL